MYIKQKYFRENRKKKEKQKVEQTWAYYLHYILTKRHTQPTIYETVQTLG